MATQYQGEVLPIRNATPVIEYRAITDKEKGFSAFDALRQVSIYFEYLQFLNLLIFFLIHQARREARQVGQREKKAREASEEDGALKKEKKK